MEYHFTKIILEFLSTIIWPIVVFLIIYLFTHQIKALINRIKDVEGLGIKVNTGILSEQEKEVNAAKKDELLTENDEITSKKNISSILNNATLNNHRFSSLSLDQTEKDIIGWLDLENVNDDSKYSVLLRYTQILYLYTNFRETYRLIYGSQIRLLKFLNENGNQTSESLRIFYTNASDQYPEFYKTYDYSEYLQWLKSRRLIMEDNGIIILTSIGKDFLVYLIDENKSDSLHG